MTRTTDKQTAAVPVLAANPAAARAAASRPWSAWVFASGEETHHSTHRTEAGARGALAGAEPRAAGRSFWSAAAEAGGTALGNGDVRAWVTRAGAL